MDKLAIISLFRNRERFIEQYKTFIEQLQWKGRIEVVCVENNSTDKTREMLEEWKEDTKKNKKLTIHITGKESNDRLYHTVVNPDRFRILAKVANIGLEYAKKLNPDYIMFIESDLIFDPDLAVELKKIVDKRQAIAAPMIWTARDKIFYDIWGFRYLPSTGKVLFAPVHKDDYKEHGLKEVLSAGSCIMFKPEFGGEFTPDLSIVGFCMTSKAKVLINQDLHIYHPQ